MKFGADVLVMCNPEITRFGQDIVSAEERCLSMPDKVFTIPRRKIITVQWQQPDSGDVRQKKLRGIDARCAQQEIEHLDGILISGDRG